MVIRSLRRNISVSYTHLDLYKRQGVFRLESQMLPGNGKIERTGLGSDSKCKEAVNTAFNYLKANGNRISGAISTSTKDYIINYQDLQGIGMKIGRAHV